ncbi:hypothetical protein GCM10010156_02730 [Planobispora rosea]|uniref:YhcG N-terminal domain-containing protein n=1 Tax=Planobispora rosea TaxID=35762 RepID=A0A8J3RVX8_PLARO|nr:hypothetical protein GCM10010156_02730 [Planobispora rosea]GIH82214.1 hypothetical protein Pro02_06220 [Planobispora rosea]
MEDLPPTRRIPTPGSNRARRVTERIRYVPSVDDCTNGKGIHPDESATLPADIKREIATSRVRTVLAANAELIQQYWRIGRHILDRQADEGWGKKVVARLSADLRTAFPEARGYSRTNLHRMSAFAARGFHARKTAEEGWTRGVLTTMIKGQFHLRTSHPLHNFDRTVPPRGPRVRQEAHQGPLRPGVPGLGDTTAPPRELEEDRH